MGWADAPEIKNNRPAWQSAPVHGEGGDADNGPAPRWDVPGDIGRAAEASATATANDVKSAFPNPLTMDLGPVASLKRMGSALKTPLDALGVVTSPLTGLLHSTAGSALSYILPTPKKDVVSPTGTTFYSDPKKAADQVLDSSMLGLAPRGLGSPAGLLASSEKAAAANEARRAAILKNKAISRVNARAAEDGLTGDELLSAQAEAAKGGDKLTLMDVGDKNVRGLAGAVYRAPGKAGKHIDEFLEGRDTAAGQALTDEVRGNVADGSTYHTIQGLLEGRSKAARPAYEAAEAVGPIHSERLQQFLDTPEVQAGLRRGLKLERQNAIAENRPMVDSDYAITGYQDGKFDMPIFGDVPTVKSMIVANEGLGAQVAEMVNPVTGRLTKDGLALKKLQTAFQSELDRLTGGKTKAARDTWSGPAQSMDAVREGKQHFTRAESNEEIKADFDALSPGDKEFYRLGAAEAKIDQLERAPDASDKSKRIINSERDRKRFRILFGSDAEADKFIQSVARKRQMFDTKTAVKSNSATAARIAEDESHGASTLLQGAHGLGQAAHGNLLGAAHSLYRLKRDLGLRNNPDLNLEIARILTDHSLPVVPGQNGRLLAELPVPKKQGTVASAALMDALLNAPASPGSPRQKR